MMVSIDVLQRTKPVSALDIGKLTVRIKVRQLLEIFISLCVSVPKPEWRVIWVECDSQGRPIRTTFVQARGDVPNTNKQLLPWSSETQDLPENGTGNTLIRCLPPRDLRKQRNHQDSVLPSNHPLNDSRGEYRDCDLRTYRCSIVNRTAKESAGSSRRHCNVDVQRHW